MKIPFNELKKAFFGAVRFGGDEHVLKPRRFTPAQVQKFVETENYIHKLWKSRASAGMTIDFYTDSETLEMDLHCYAASKSESYYIDVYINGKLYDHRGYNIEESKDVSILVSLPHDRKRVTVYLSPKFGTDITKFELSDGSTFKPAEKKRKLLFLGDSITQGYSSEFPSLSYANIITRHLDAECINQGIASGVFCADDLDPDLPFKPDTVFVGYGTNDWAHNRDIRNEAHKYLDKLTGIYPNSRIYAILPLWRGYLERYGAKATISFDEVHDELKKACSGFKNITVIDGRDLVPGCMSLFAPDATHPNDLGFIFFSSELLKIIE